MSGKESDLVPSPHPEPEPEPTYWWSADEEASRQQLLEKYGDNTAESEEPSDFVPAEKDKELGVSVSDESSAHSTQEVLSDSKSSIFRKDLISDYEKSERSDEFTKPGIEQPDKEISFTASNMESTSGREEQDDLQSQVRQTSLTSRKESAVESDDTSSVDQISDVQAGSSKQADDEVLQSSLKDDDGGKGDGDPCFSLGSDDLSLSGKQFNVLASSTFRISKNAETGEIERLKAENQEQEHLLRAYQKENERLYSELKHAKHQLKTTIAELKSENEHLGFTVAQLREELQIKESLKNSPFTLKQKSVGLATGSSLQSSPIHKAECEEVKVLKEANEKLSSDLVRLKDQLKSEQEMVAILRNTVEEKNKTIQLKSKQIAVLKKKNIMLGDRLRSIPKISAQVSSITQKKLKTSPSKYAKSADKMVIESDVSVKTPVTPKTKFMPQSTYTKTDDSIVEKMTHTLLEQRVLQLQKKLQTYEAEKKQSLEVLESKFASLKTEYAKRLEQQNVQFLKEKAELVGKICDLEARSSALVPESNASKQLHVEKSPEMHSKHIQVALLRSKDYGDLLEINNNLQQKIDLLTRQLKGNESRLKRMSQVQLENTALEKQVEVIMKQLNEAEVGLGRVSELEKLNTSLEKQVETRSQRLNEMETKLKQMSHLEKENAALEKHIKELEIQVFKALENQSVESKQFKAMNKEISWLENRHHQRERALQNYIRKMQMSHHKALIAEGNKWRARLVEQFNEVDYFREQLDRVVEVLEELKRRGVHVPSVPQQ